MDDKQCGATFKITPAIVGDLLNSILRLNHKERSRVCYGTKT
ncbi:hypothetical protein SAMN05216362_12533 [Piscibacillus halophilus]|uniref:Uncharacterized protein n=1 Tax=Piscibacillus halophilus TaxID=571933 RepID=A0A1H9IKT5_9BACI|nr:hypothetical protein SAMN05216362_12533 [Piscibacillus halophilus]